MTKVNQSAIVVIPPEDQWEQIQAIRAVHDKGYIRWMPHINMIYPFIPESDYKDHLNRVSEKLSGCSPFQLAFESFDSFQHAKSYTLYLKPNTEPPDALKKLHTDLFEVFPFCDDLSTIGENGFSPHLTVGQFTGKVQLDRAKAKFSADFKPIRFTVSHVHFISRSEKDPFKIIYSVPLGEKKDFTSEIERKSLSAQRDDPTVSNINNTEDNTKDNTKDNTQPALHNEKKPFEYSDDQVPFVAERVFIWLYDQSQRKKLPKTVNKLKAAINKMCLVPYEITSIDAVYDRLKSEGYFAVENDVVTYPEKNEELKKVKIEEEEKNESYCIRRSKEMILAKQSLPNTEQSLKNRIQQFTFGTRLVDPNAVLGFLEWKGYLKLVGFDGITYFI